MSGVFLDSAVEGLEYVAGSAAKASTDATGKFTCLTGDRISFSVGGIALGSANCSGIITPLTLADTTDAKDVRVVNRLLALQLLDDDDDASNGIRITSAVKAALASAKLDFTLAAADFAKALAAVLPAVTDGTGALYSERPVDDRRRLLAREYFESTLASQLATPAVETVTQTTGVGSISANVTRQMIQFDDKFYIPYSGSNPATKADFAKGFLPAYGSGLSLKGKRADGTLEFYAITDRGPNATTGPITPITDGSSTTGTASSTVFPSPGFTPSIGLVTLGKDGAKLESTLPIKFSATQNANGRVQPRGTTGNTGEQILDDTFTYPGDKLGYSEYGLDTETVVVDAARNALWVSDEYGPFIVRIDPATGIVQKKYRPGTGPTDLPAVLAKRRANRGMEGLTIEVASGKLHGFLQSPLDDGKADYTTTAIPGATNKPENVRDYARFVRWIEFNPSTEQTKLYALPIDNTWYSQGKTGNAKLGDVVSLGNGKFIAIEQGARASDGKVFNDLVLIEIPSNATDITALGSDLEKSSLTGSNVNGADYSTVVPLKKTRLFNLNAAGWLAEKAEGLALVDENTLALTNDTDFGVSLVVLDANGQEIEGSDVTKCTVDASGKIVDNGKCAKGAAGFRFTKNDIYDRAQRLWTIKFSKKLSEYSTAN